MSALRPPPSDVTVPLVSALLAAEVAIRPLGIQWCFTNDSLPPPGYQTKPLCHFQLNSAQSQQQLGLHEHVVKLPGTARYIVCYDVALLNRARSYARRSHAEVLFFPQLRWGCKQCFTAASIAYYLVVSWMHVCVVGYRCKAPAQRQIPVKYCIASCLSMQSRYLSYAALQWASDIRKLDAATLKCCKKAVLHDSSFPRVVHSSLAHVHCLLISTRAAPYCLLLA
jgi:hypothetical protein